MESRELPDGAAGRNRSTHSTKRSLRFETYGIFMRRHSRAVMRFGGALLITVGVMLLTGWWASLVSIMQHHFPQSVLV